MASASIAIIVLSKRSPARTRQRLARCICPAQGARDAAQTNRLTRAGDSVFPPQEAPSLSRCWSTNAVSTGLEGSWLARRQLRRGAVIRLNNARKSNRATLRQRETNAGDDGVERAERSPSGCRHLRVRTEQMRNGAAQRSAEARRTDVADDVDPDGELLGRVAAQHPVFRASGSPFRTLRGPTPLTMIPVGGGNGIGGAVVASCFTRKCQSPTGRSTTAGSCCGAGLSPWRARNCGAASVNLINLHFYARAEDGNAR